MKEQDFSRKMVVVVRKDLEPWQVLNTVAHASAYLGNKLKGDFDTGEFFVSKDNKNHLRNSQYAIIILAAEKGDLYPLIEQARARNLLHINFLRDMIDLTEDAELEKVIAEQNDAELDYLGVGMFGEKEVLKELTGKFKLWK